MNQHPNPNANANADGPQNPDLNLPIRSAVMALDATSRIRVSAQYQRDGLCPGPITKAQLAAAIAATDDWIEANQAAFNAALPVAFRTAATVAQKTDLFCFVAQRRANRLPTADD